MSDLKREAALREVLVRGVPVNDDDDLDALLGGEALEEKTITESKKIGSFMSYLVKSDNKGSKFDK